MVAAVLGSSIVFLDGTIVNVALPSIGESLPHSVFSVLEGQTYVTSGYLATLAALLILAGALSDFYGRRRVFAIGLAGFGLTSVLCGLSPSLELLVVFRVLQGAAGALLVPCSLSIITATFDGPARGRAFGIWAAATSATSVLGPTIGGLLIQAISWRVAFLINVPLVVLALYATIKYVDESRDENATGRFDWLGAIVVALAVGGLAFGAIRGQAQQWHDPVSFAALIVGAIALVAFPILMAKRANPLIPLGMFRVRAFAMINLSTLLIYGALYVVFGFQSLFLQGTLGYAAFAAGAVGLPTGLMLTFLSTRIGSLAGRLGGRRFLTAGPLVMAAGLLWLGRIPSTSAPVDDRADPADRLLDRHLPRDHPVRPRDQHGGRPPDEHADELGAGLECGDRLGDQQRDLAGRPAAPVGGDLHRDHGLVLRLAGGQGPRARPQRPGAAGRGPAAQPAGRGNGPGDRRRRPRGIDRRLPRGDARGGDPPGRRSRRQLRGPAPVLAGGQIRIQRPRPSPRSGRDRGGRAAGMSGPRDWDAATYDRVADPMTRWGATVLDRLPLAGNETVLDAGCGSGRVTERLARALPDGRVIALDGSAAMLDEARTRLAPFAPRIEYVLADLRRPLPIAEPVDAILSTATFHWLPDHPALFRNLAAVLRPGGRLVAQCGGAGNIASVVAILATLGDGWTGPWTFATPAETAERLAAAGFAEIDTWLQDEPTPLEPGPPHRGVPAHGDPRRPPGPAARGRARAVRAGGRGPPAASRDRLRAAEHQRPARHLSAWRRRPRPAQGPRPLTASRGWDECRHGTRYFQESGLWSSNELGRSASTHGSGL